MQIWGLFSAELGKDLSSFSPCKLDCIIIPLEMSLFTCVFVQYSLGAGTDESHEGIFCPTVVMCLILNFPLLKSHILY